MQQRVIKIVSYEAKKEENDLKEAVLECEFPPPNPVVKFDYQPDLCNRLIRDGYCGYGDGCRWRHPTYEELDEIWRRQAANARNAIAKK
jgi:hypothetical protein